MANPENVKADLWTVTAALREALTAGQVWPHTGFALPLDVIGKWACPCGHQLSDGIEITWQTVGVRLIRPEQPCLF